MTAPFEGCWRRIDRAAEHRDAQASEWNAFLDEEPYEVRLEADDDVGNFTIWIDQVVAVPASIALHIGEWLYQLRAALDNCIYDVAVHDGGSNPPPGHERLEFPICNDMARFQGVARTKLGPLSKDHRAWVELVQPGQAGGDAMVVPGRTALYWLHELARIDRHRSLHVVGAWISESDPLVFAPRSSAHFISDLSAHGPITVDGKTELVRFRVAPYAPGDDVSTNPQVALDPELSEWVERKPPHEPWGHFTFGERWRFIELFVEAIIGRFERDVIGQARAERLLRPEP